jgi:hypothetical protein
MTAPKALGILITVCFAPPLPPMSGWSLKGHETPTEEEFAEFKKEFLHQLTDEFTYERVKK